MLAKVINVSVTETDVLVHVITLEGDDIRTTMFHPFYVKSIVEENESRYNGEWKAASNLIAGDELLTEDGRVIYVEEVRIERLAKNSNIYIILKLRNHIHILLLMEFWYIMGVEIKILVMKMIYFCKMNIIMKIDYQKKLNQVFVIFLNMMSLEMLNT